MIEKKPDWLSMQYDSFEGFFSQSHSSELSLHRLLKRHFPLSIEGDFTLNIEDWQLTPPSPMSLHQRDLWFVFSLAKKQAGEKLLHHKLIGKVPAPTPDSEFVLVGKKSNKANRYVMTMQLALAPGLYYSEHQYLTEKTEKEVLNRICKISPVLGKTIFLRSREKRSVEGDWEIEVQQFFMDGLDLPLEAFMNLLENDSYYEPQHFWAIYHYLKRREIIPEKKNVLTAEAPPEAEIKKGVGRFREYLGAFDMSRLGKKQLASIFGALIDERNTGLSIQELKEVVKRFLERDIPQSDDRSLKNRQVKRVGDFLFQHLDQAIISFKEQVRKLWSDIYTRRFLKGEPPQINDLQEILPFRPFQEALYDLFTGSELLQLLDDTNPLAEISQKRRLTFRGPGGIPEGALYLEKRDVHPTDFGRLCPVETPQGEDLGFNLYLAQDARINKLGLIEARYKEISTGEEVFLDPYEEESQVKAVQVGPIRESGLVQARKGKEELTYCRPEETSHTTVNSFGFLGYAAALIPFFQNNDANRALMGANMMKQALPLLNPQPPLIKSGLEVEIARQYGKTSPFILKDEEGLCLGRNLLVGYMPWNLLNYEDGLVVSERLVDRKILTHVEREEIFFDEMAPSKGKPGEEGSFEEITRDNEHLDKSVQALLDEHGIIQKNTEIKPGMVLVSKLMGSYQKTQAEKREELGDHGRQDASFYAPDPLHGKVIEVELLQFWLPSGVNRRVRLVVEREHDIQVGDKLTGRHGNKGVVARILAERDMPYYHSEGMDCNDHQCLLFQNQVPHTHLEVLINPLTITGRMNLGQLYETTLGWLAMHQEDVEGYTVPPFDSSWSWEKIKNKMQDLNLEVKQTLFYWGDEKEIQIENPITVGYQYFLKLRHLAAKKIKVRDQFVYSPVTGQPTVPSFPNDWQRRSANRRTPQRLGEMEVWALQGHMAWNILDEFLFLKSDDENLRKNLVILMQSETEARRRIFQDLRDKAREERKTWKFEEEDDALRVSFPQSPRQENLLRQWAKELGLKVEKLEVDFLKSNFLLTNAALDIIPREHRALKALVHYCRALGLEIKGINDGGTEFNMVGPRIASWQDLSGLTIRLAADEERGKWADSKLVTSAGYHPDHGLWSDDIFGSFFSNNRLTNQKAHEATAVIELSVPIDNPIFRSVLNILLDEEGYDLREIRENLQELLTRICPQEMVDWQLFWEKALKERSRLQTESDLKDWLEILCKEEGGIIPRDLPKLLKEYLPKARLFNYQEVIKPDSPFYLPARYLYQHFKVMDLEYLKARLQSQLEVVPKKHHRKKAHLEWKIEFISLLLRNGYQPTAFFLQNLLVLPKNLRFDLEAEQEKERILKAEKEREAKHPSAKKAKEKWPKREFFRYQNDLNYFYSRILWQNEKIRNFRGLVTQVDFREEERLRQLVHGLLVNGKMKEVLPEPFYNNGRPRRSILTEITGDKTGKEGIFRKHLLGKRVDFSGRAVIVPDPDLGLDEAGLPYRIGRALFRDILVHRILQGIPAIEPVFDHEGRETRRIRKIPYAIRKVKAMAFLRKKGNEPQIHDWLDELAESEKYLVLLNRAPSLHRLSTLAFRPIFFEHDDVLRLNPYVCAPFNADFDGDTMGIYLPLLSGSKQEARNMLPSKALRSPGHGRLFINCKADLALAAHLASLSVEGREKLSPLTSTLSPFQHANADFLSDLFDHWSQDSETFGEKIEGLTPFCRETLNRCGFSLDVSDFILIENFSSLTSAWEKEVWDAALENKEPKIDSWDDMVAELEKRLDEKVESLTEQHPLKILLSSKASNVQLHQIFGMRGLMLRPGGSSVMWPVLGNMVQGMSPLEYFVSCHGSRYGLSDKGLMTAPAGDLTNILVQAAQWINIVEEDCGSQDGLCLSAFEDPVGGSISLAERLEGRCLAEKVRMADGREIQAGTVITREIAGLLAGTGAKWVRVRSPLTCQALDTISPAWRSFRNKMMGLTLANSISDLGLEAGVQLTETNLFDLARLRLSHIEVKRNGDDVEKVKLPYSYGLCQKCYGWDLATGALPPQGYPAGVIAGQSIGEPGTQLTLRNFHTGGIGGQEISQGLMAARKAFLFGSVAFPDRSAYKGEESIIISPDNVPWLEVSGPQGPRCIPLPESMMDAVSLTIPLKDNPKATPEYLLQFYQIIYNAKSRVADHHFEVVFRAMNALQSGGMTALHAAGEAPGFLARLAFRDTKRHLVEAALNRQTDWLQGFKEKIITGSIRPKNLMG